jgi:hypothetical protein
MGVGDKIISRSFTGTNFAMSAFNGSISATGVF